MKPLSYVLPLALFCLGAAAGCKQRAEEPPTDPGNKVVASSGNDSRNLKVRVPAATEDDNDAKVVVAWKKAGAIFDWYVPNKPSPGDWMVSHTRTNDPGILPVFTWTTLEPGVLGKLPRPAVPFALIVSNNFTDAGLKEVASFDSLEYLSLNGSNVTDDGLKELAGLKHLRALNLNGTAVTDRGLKELASFKGLQCIYLANAKVTDKGLKDLAVLTNVTFLGLSGTAVTDAGLKELAGLSNLQTLTLYATAVTDEGAARLHASLPDLKIKR
jgi:hypothetical protein